MARRTHAAPRGFRLEHDSMGTLQVPASALWGAQTQRARDNFRISGRPMPDNSSNCGVATAPADRITSRPARASFSWP